MLLGKHTHGLTSMEAFRGLYWNDNIHYVYISFSKNKNEIIQFAQFHLMAFEYCSLKSLIMKCQMGDKIILFKLHVEFQIWINIWLIVYCTIGYNLWQIKCQIVFPFSFWSYEYVNKWQYKLDSWINFS